LAQQPPPPVGYSLLTHEVSSPHYKDAPQSVWLLWTSDQLVAENCTWQHTKLTRQTSMWPVGFEPTISAGALP